MEEKNQKAKSRKEEIMRTIKEQAFKGIKNICTEGSGYLETMDIANQIVENIMKNKNVVSNLFEIKMFDEITYRHSLNVATYSVTIGILMGLSRTSLTELAISGLLHDIGKTKIPKEILNKPGSLTEEEYEIVKEHAMDGYEYLTKEWNLPNLAKLAILDHHERYNGTGYPNGKKGRRISLLGRIVAVADVYDAMASTRPYKEALLPGLARKQIYEESGKLFDPEVVQVFYNTITPYPVGLKVTLSNGKKGVIKANHKESPATPIIKLENGKEIDLLPSKNRQAIRIIECEQVSTWFGTEVDEVAKENAKMGDLQRKSEI